MFVLLDTHVLLWLDQDVPDLGSIARRQADHALRHGHLAVSAISFWEVAMLMAKGRITMTLPPAVWRRDLLRLGLIEVPLDGEVGIAAAQLDPHCDPADRIIAATAIGIGATLLTANQALLDWQHPLPRSDARR
jgi:PIN domain nuclease of toxin-antitoxin system